MFVVSISTGRMGSWTADGADPDIAALIRATLANPPDALMLSPRVRLFRLLDSI
jgi:hypothetical protein